MHIPKRLHLKSPCETRVPAGWSSVGGTLASSQEWSCCISGIGAWPCTATTREGRGRQNAYSSAVVKAMVAKAGRRSSKGAAKSTQLPARQPSHGEGRPAHLRHALRVLLPPAPHLAPVVAAGLAVALKAHLPRLHAVQGGQRACHGLHTRVLQGGMRGWVPGSGGAHAQASSSASQTENKQANRQAGRLAWYTAVRWAGAMPGSEGSVKMRPLTCSMT